MLCKKIYFLKFLKIHRKTLCQSFLFNKVADLRPATLLQKRLWHIGFPVNFNKILRTRFPQNTSGRMLLLLDNLRKSK